MKAMKMVKRGEETGYVAAYQAENESGEAKHQAHISLSKPNQSVKPTNESVSKLSKAMAKKWRKAAAAATRRLAAGEKPKAGLAQLRRRRNMAMAAGLAG